MATPEELEKTQQATPRATLEPRRDRADTPGQRAVEALGRQGRGELVLGTTLGQGGMGLVRAAVQTSVGRTVAVKTLRPDRRGTGEAMQLLREAWVTGRVEHPNVVPVYDVAVEPDGTPQVVLRRIEGTEWAALLQEPEEVARRFGADDLLDWNLRVLVQVCNALEVAHQRGLLHRDLKPENVMVGDLGETYLLDWGIAVSFIDDGTGRLPLAADARDPAGTPAYMAPEMWSADPARLSVRTDVYLLGGLLHELLTGRPPHSGRTLLELRTHAEQPPTLEGGPGRPQRLVDLCRRCLDPDPAERPASALAVRRAIEEFLSRRGAELLVEEASATLAALQRVLARPAPERATVYNLYGATRFGFEQALHRVPDVANARAGLVAATSALIDYELAAGDPKAAATLLIGLADAPPALRERVEAAQRAHAEAEEKRQRFEALGRQVDTTIGLRTRLFIGGLVGLTWTVVPLIAYFTGDWPHSHLGWILGSLGFVGLGLAIVVWARDSLSRTAINRALAITVPAIPLGQIPLVLACSWLGIGVPETEVLLLFYWSVIALGVALAVERRLLGAASVFVVCFLVAARWPAYRKPLMAVGNIVLVSGAVQMGWSTLKELWQRHHRC